MRVSYISVCEACRECGGISKSTFYARVVPELERIAQARGEASSVRIGRRRLIRRHILQAFLEALARSCGWFLICGSLLYPYHLAWQPMRSALHCPVMQTVCEIG